MKRKGKSALGGIRYLMSGCYQGGNRTSEGEDAKLQAGCRAQGDVLFLAKDNYDKKATHVEICRYGCLCHQV